MIEEGREGEREEGERKRQGGTGGESLEQWRMISDITCNSTHVW